MKTKEMVVGKIEQLTASGEFILPEAKLVDCLNKNHPLVVEYVKDLKEENQLLKEKLDRADRLNKELLETRKKQWREANQLKEQLEQEMGQRDFYREKYLKCYGELEEESQELRERCEATEKMYQGALALLTAKERR